MDDSLKEFLVKFHRASKAEVAQILKDNLGYWPHPDISKEDALDALDFKVPDPKRTPVDSLRKEIVAYIKRNEGRLSMKCDGDCFKHPDGVVVACHILLQKELRHQEDSDAETGPETI